jgi:hypothetical protein
MKRALEKLKIHIEFLPENLSINATSSGNSDAQVKN